MDSGSSRNNPQSRATLGKPDAPWMIRTYAGHSSATESNALYRSNLAKGQTGLSVAFDLPTQTGYDPDHPLARGEVGRVGVSIAHLGDLRELFDGISVSSMNTSMTINATAPWLMALYIAVADEQGAPRAALRGTTQNDIIKEYLSRGAYVFPPAPSMRLSCDLIRFAARETPRWNPVNICSYHLQEAGATPVQEVAFALCTALTILESLQAAQDLSQEQFAALVGQVSFFVNASTRFIREAAKMRAFAALWNEITRDVFGVQDERQRRFRYGVQVNSLGLTEPQPENNVYRIVISMLGVVLSRDARARAIQLPAWNEALGLPRPFDQQWSLRAQQVMAYETDLLDYPDILDGSGVIAALTGDMIAQVRVLMSEVAAQGGAVAAVESGWIKSQLVDSNTARLEAIERGDTVVVGVNRFTETEPSPLLVGIESIAAPDPAVEERQIAKLAVWKASRDPQRVASCLEALRQAAAGDGNIMEPSIDAAKAGVTTGEWAGVLRGVYGEYRAPTGVPTVARQVGAGLDGLRDRVEALAMRLGRRPALLVGKPGLDGHSNGAEQIAVRARDVGFDVVYEGIRSTAEAIVAAAVKKDVHCIGLSVLSGAHLSLAEEVTRLLERAGRRTAVVVGGIVPAEDEPKLKALGVARVYTPKDFDLSVIVDDLVTIIEASAT